MMKQQIYKANAIMSLMGKFKTNAPFKKSHWDTYASIMSLMGKNLQDEKG